MTKKYTYIQLGENTLYSVRWTKRGFSFTQNFYAKDNEAAIKEGKKIAPLNAEGLEISAVLKEVNESTKQP